MQPQTLLYALGALLTVSALPQAPVGGGPPDIPTANLRILAASTIGGVWSPSGNGGTGGSYLGVFCLDGSKKDQDICPYGGETPPFSTGMKDDVTWGCGEVQYKYRGLYNAGSAKIEECYGNTDLMDDVAGTETSDVTEYYGEFFHK